MLLIDVLFQQVQNLVFNVLMKYEKNPIKSGPGVKGFKWTRCPGLGNGPFKRDCDILQAHSFVQGQLISTSSANLIMWFAVWDFCVKID